jgi:hypothetical protein
MAINPSPFDAVVSNPIENLVTVIIPGEILIHLLNFHICTYYLIVFSAHLSIFINHSVYDKRHLLHHKMFNCNFGASKYTDILFGTYYNDHLTK